MILSIGVIVALYVITRCVAMMGRWKSLVNVLCGVTIVIALYGIFVMFRNQREFVQELQRTTQIP